jgi:small subunit ribosomal protein S17
MADEETTEPATGEPEETVETPEVPALEVEAEENAEAQADTAATEAEVEETEDTGGGQAAPAHRAEPVEVLPPKERRRRKRAAKEAPSRGPVSHEDRQAERDALRAKNAHARRGERLKARQAKPQGEAAAASPAAIEHAVGRPKARQGVVVSDKAAKTITVRVDTSRRHRRYKKIVRSSKMLHAHDENNEANEGDLVRVVETRPLSATKRWRLIEILERAK